MSDNDQLNLLSLPMKSGEKKYVSSVEDLGGRCAREKESARWSVGHLLEVRVSYDGSRNVREV